MQVVELKKLSGRSIRKCSKEDMKSMKSSAITEGGNINDPHVHVLYPNNLMKVFMRVQTYNRGNHNKTIPYAISYIRKFVKRASDRADSSA